MWLMENGSSHLLALINWIEGKVQALQWLESNGYKALSIAALAADGNKSAKECTEGIKAFNDNEVDVVIITDMILV